MQIIDHIIILDIRKCLLFKEPFGYVLVFALLPPLYLVLFSGGLTAKEVRMMMMMMMMMNE